MTKRIDLNPKFLDSRKPEAGKRLAFADITPGLVFQLTDKGAKSWQWRGYHPTTKAQQKKTLGSYPALGVAIAREMARARNEAVANGYDYDEREAENAAANAAEIEAKEAHASKTFEWYWTELYRPRFVVGKRDEYEMDRKFNKHLNPHIGHIPIVDITLDDLDDCVQELAERAPVSANRLATFIKTVFKRSMSITEFRRKTGMKIDPATHLSKPCEEGKGRTRWLEDDREIITLYRALSRMKGVCVIHAGIIDLILDTGVRLSNARCAEWDDFNFAKGQWRLPGTKMKNGLPFILPLASETLERLRERRRATNGEWVFPAPTLSSLGYAVGNQGGPLSSMSLCMKTLRAECEAIAEADGWRFEHWSAHTLRHTFVSHLRQIAAEQGDPLVNTDSVEASVHHVEGGIKGRYNQFDFLKGKERCLRVWQDKLVKLRLAAEKAEAELTGQTSEVAA